MSWTDTIGLFSPSSAMTYLRNSNSAGFADVTFPYGPANTGWQILSGDWNGDGVDTIGLYNASSSTFYLKDSSSAGAADLKFVFNPVSSGAAPIVGDWDGNGTVTVGLYDPSTSTFYLKNSNVAGSTADLTFVYGSADASLKPVAGDWNGDGLDTIGTYDPATATFSLRNANSAGDPDAQFVYGPANSGWKPIVGDWNGDGLDTVGMYSTASSNFHLRETNSAGYADHMFQYGPPGQNWTPIIGDWNGAGSALSAANGVATDANAAAVTTSELSPTVREAIARWTATGLSTEALTTLANAKFSVADLPGAKLGLTDGDTIFIDKDAAGHGWFVDSTPSQDEEFANGLAIDPRALDGIDLLTVVEHELGHILGRSDLDSSMNDLMSGTLSEGVRRNSTAEVDAVFAAV
jgi:hypothetical protein